MVSVGVFLLSGCGMMDKMDATNRYVRLTYEQMQDLHNGQTVGGAVEIFKDETADEFIRLRSLLIFFEKANLTEVIWQYLGAPRPIYSERVGAVDRYRVSSASGSELFNFRNVTYVGERSVWHEIRHPAGAILYRKVLKPVSPEFYQLLSLAVGDALEQVRIFDQVAETQEQVEENQGRALRVMHIGTTVYGGLRLDLPAEARAVDSQFLSKSQSEYMLSEAERASFAEQMASLLTTVGLEEQLPVLKSLVESRLGLPAPAWSR
jgi:hypothetical protein